MELSGFRIGERFALHHTFIQVGAGWIREQTLHQGA